ncbi:MAG: hypothetical protein QOH26_1171 [Actinomycetota bacterium]|jgi:hypothetical protein|nr:hypothetical protein [Actinomycetota bacterium]
MAVLGLIVGLIIGALIGRSDPDPSESVSLIRTSLLSAAGSLDVATVEYQESVEDGAVVSRPEYDGALDAIRSSRGSFEEVRTAVEVLAPERVDSIEELYDEVEAQMEAMAPATEVEATLQELEALLKGQ